MYYIHFITYSEVPGIKTWTSLSTVLLTTLAVCHLTKYSFVGLQYPYLTNDIFLYFEDKNQTMKVKYSARSLSYTTIAQLITTTVTPKIKI
jgi:hypothetical protein